MSCIHETHSLISELDSDILWYIFSLNADMELESEESHPALHTLRKTSQVCRLWREIALGSSPLWGRVVNMAALTRKGDWRDEVIRRTGSSWLCIKATGHTLYHTEHFVKSLLAEHWGRLRSLELHFNQYCTSVDDETWRFILRRPAAILETFKFTFHHAQPPFFSAADFAIFSNHAPALRTISVIGIAWNVKAPWTSALRHLALNSSIPVFETLLSLVSIPLPFLETLELSDSNWDALQSNITRPLRAASFPRLRRIKLYPMQQIEFVLSLLAHITPAAGCAIDFYGTRTLVDNAVIDLIPDVLSKYLGYTPSGLRSSFLGRFIDMGLYQLLVF
ncbi:hypothetical protein GALMADRAFT_716487 [Galerina marginata CBS 339.88]|uniref:Uncharacterized protein n=1 Tax=Galerina marginata (strain CBS 339.88) TaxID=685588 RepID=A0A067TZM7_GALM3|nr:hypothetical protein GALMADRAFT_716487 [Galerina marginata CBS 339.88]